MTEITPELADALYEATGGDIEFNVRDGIAFLAFSRSAPTLREAIRAGIQQVEGANAGVRVVRAEAEAANTIGKINAELYEVITKE